MDRDTVQDWLDRYAEAWRTYDEARIGDLWSEDAEYRYHPADEPVVGRAAIVQSWVEPDGDASTRDAEGTYDGEYRAWAVDGDRAVALGTSRYWSDASRTHLERVYDNCYLLEFDGEGRCRSFTEFYRQRPDTQPD
jgi:ketosteroid isomerase-like protein